MKNTEKNILQELQGKSFAQEIENDKAKAAAYIEREGFKREERQAIAIYKRVHMLIGSGDMKIHDNNNKTRDASDNNLPISSYISHGSRVLVELPANSGNDLINWLTSGNKNIDGRSNAQSQQEANDENKAVYNRSAATHKTENQLNSQGEFEAVEKKGLGIGVADFVGNVFGKKTNHYGVDLALNVDKDGKDSLGNDIDHADGDHGHLYIYYQEPKDGKPGSILIGIEGGAPTSSKHSILGNSEPLSPVDGSKFSVLVDKKQIAGETEYKDTIVPKQYGGMTIKLDPENLKKIVELDDKKYGAELADALPRRSALDLATKLENRNCNHISPKLQPSKELKALAPKPSNLHKIINFIVKSVTLGLVRPYQKELDTYKSQLKTHKAQSKIQANDTQRLKPKAIPTLHDTKQEFPKDIPLILSLSQIKSTLSKASQQTEPNRQALKGSAVWQTNSKARGTKPNRQALKGSAIWQTNSKAR